MNEALVILTFSALFTITLVAIARVDFFIGGVYFFLYVYTIFAQIGYAYYPELSSLLNAYFGRDVLYRYNVFVTLSFLTFFFAFKLLYRPFISVYQYSVVRSQPSLPALFCLIVAAHMVSMAAYALYRYEDLGYANASDESFLSQQSFAYTLFHIGFKLSPPIIFILYYLLRLRSAVCAAVNVPPAALLLLCELVVFAGIAVKIGSRTDIVAVFMAVLILEMYLGLTRRKIIAIAMCVGLVAYGLTTIQTLRGTSVGDVPTIEAILLQDYYAPAHILFAAIAHEYVQPMEVLVSNVANSLVLLEYPYLQNTVIELFNPSVATRSASYAFYIFSEGYLVAGQLGFLYNGIMVLLGVMLWRSLAMSTNQYYNLFMLGLISTQMVNIVRSQTSYFIKDLYVVFLPAALLFFLATGYRPRIGIASARRLETTKE